MPSSHTNSPQTITRRQSLKSGLAGIIASGAAPMVIASELLGKNAPSNQITLAGIGVGGHGFGYNLRSFLQLKAGRVLAVCDVFKSRMKRAADAVNKKYKSNGCRQIPDFRNVLADKSIDAVIISTPDHWHVPISLLALDAGKDVFCEKPTLTIAEGRELVYKVKKHNAIFQTGLEDRSVIYYHKMAEIVRNGGIGKLKAISVTLPAGENFAYEKPEKPPADLNYPMWLGPAPYAPYSRTRTGAQQWRNIRDYSGGKLTDWGAHLIDTANVANFAELSGPVEVHGKGHTPKNAMTTVPTKYNIDYKYANGVTMNVKSGGVAIRFDGTDGWVGNKGWRGRLKASSDDILRKKYPREGNKLWPLPTSEHRDFLACVKSRKRTTYTAEDLHRLSTVMHIGNISMELGRKLKWDPKTESFDDSAANKLRARESRDDWKKL